MPPKRKLTDEGSKQNIKQLKNVSYPNAPIVGLPENISAIIISHISDLKSYIALGLSSSQWFTRINSFLEKRLAFYLPFSHSKYHTVIDKQRAYLTLMEASKIVGDIRSYNYDFTSDASVEETVTSVIIRFIPWETGIVFVFLPLYKHGGYLEAASIQFLSQSQRTPLYNLNIKGDADRVFGRAFASNTKLKCVGICWMTPNTQIFHIYSIINETVELVAAVTYNEGHEMSVPETTTMVIDDDGMVWLGEGSEVKCYSLKDKQFKPSPFVPDILAVNPARSQVYQINGSVKAIYHSSNFEEQQKNTNVYVFDVQTLESKLLLNSRFAEECMVFAYEDTFKIWESDSIGISSYVYKEPPIGFLFCVTNQTESDIVMSPTGAHFLLSCDAGNRLSLYEVRNYPIGQKNNYGETIIELGTKLNAMSINDRTDMDDDGDCDGNNNDDDDDDDDNKGEEGNEDNETDITMIQNHMHCLKFQDITIRSTDQQAVGHEEWRYCWSSNGRILIGMTNNSLFILNLDKLGANNRLRAITVPIDGDWTLLAVETLEDTLSIAAMDFSEGELVVVKITL